MSKATKQEKEHAVDWLRNHIKPGQKVYTTVNHVSRSGMQRTISAFIVIDGEVVNVSGYVSLATGYTRDHKRGGCKLSGCGMDIGFQLVYQLGWALFPNGGLVEYSQRRAQEERAGKSHETDGGYMLNHGWL